MVAAPVGERALPLAWRVKATEGAIGFPEQREALEAASRLLPEGIRPVLMGGRFYGSPELIAWCRARGWDWRLRLERDLLVLEDGGETTWAACLARGEHLLSGVELTGKRVATNVAMVHEPGHPEPWIIALSEPPTTHRAFDYGLRWGIEATFPDFETRGFGAWKTATSSAPSACSWLWRWPCSGPSRPACGTPSTAPRPTKKSPGAPTPRPPPRPDLALQARHPTTSDLPTTSRSATAAVERLGELMGGKLFSQRSLTSL